MAPAAAKPTNAAKPPAAAKPEVCYRACQLHKPELTGAVHRKYNAPILTETQVYTHCSLNLRYDNKPFCDRGHHMNKTGERCESSAVEGKLVCSIHMKDI